MVEIDFLAANHVRIIGMCGQNWNRTLGYLFALRSVKAYFRKMLLSIWLHCWPRDHSAWAWPAVGTGPGPLGTSSSQFIDWCTEQLSNCQDGCQTNSRRYDDLLSTNSVEHMASFWPTILSVVPLAQCVICLSFCHRLSVCDVLYCCETVRPSEKVSEGVNRKPGWKSSFLGSPPYFYFRRVCFRRTPWNIAIIRSSRQRPLIHGSQLVSLSMIGTEDLHPYMRLVASVVRCGN